MLSHICISCLHIFEIYIERLTSSLKNFCVSGTTIYSIVEKLKSVNVKSIRVFVLGVNEEFYNPKLFQYVDEDDCERNYIQAPYLPVSDAACMKICSNVVSTFALALSPYDVNFPRYNCITVSKNFRKNPILQYIKSCRSISSDTIYIFYFDSTPTIDIEHRFIGLYRRNYVMRKKNT